MSKQIPKNQFNYGAGKGDHERPVDRTVFRSNFDLIDFTKSPQKQPVKKKNGRVSYSY